jgi:orotate phosphoribosyltransferase
MTNVPLNKETVDQYLSKLTKESALDFLRKNDFEKIRSSCLQDTEDKLVNLMIDCGVFAVKKNQEIIENGQKSCFYIHILEIIEKGYSDTLASLFANFIQNSINDDEYSRVVGLLCTRDGDKHNVSRERYNLAPVTASKLKKPPFELLFRENRAKQPIFLMNGKINHHEKVILIDEMITTGGNIKRAIKYLNKEDVEIQEVFILVSRTSEKKMTHIKQRLSAEFGVNLHCILSIEKLLSSLLKKGYISLEEHNRVTEEIENQKIVTF